jgi:zinc transport system substrate-binding protein
MGTINDFLTRHVKTAGRLLIILFMLLACTLQTAGADPPLKVYVVNYPLKYFAERIGGDYVTVAFPAPSDADPAYWNPDIETVSAYQKADLILLNGAGYAKWISKVSLPRLKMADTSKAFRDQYIASQEIVTHSHGGEGQHAHESLAFTTWLDFSLAARQAEAVAAAMSRKRPDLRAGFMKNYAALEEDLKALDREMLSMVSADPSRPLIVSHPVYDYFGRRYGLNIVSLHWEPGQYPSNEQWKALEDILKRHPAKHLIWEGDPLGKTRERLETLGVQSLVFEPCGNTPAGQDFLGAMRRNIENLRPAFSASKQKKGN